MSDPWILAVIALYNCELSHSQTASSLLPILEEHPELAEHFSLVLYDNSPHPQSHVASAYYFHDPANGGLAAAYNFALARARLQACEWLLLLDQDTTLTYAFVAELVDTAQKLRDQATVAMIAPKLLVHGAIHSPGRSFIDQLRRQFRPAKPAFARETMGVQQKPLFPYNSASAIRVSALQSIGGFPAEFWLDFLDHAVFHALSLSGYHFYLLRAALDHNSSYADVCSVPLWRLENVLVAQALFLKRHGNFFDRLLLRIWLLRHARGLWRSCKDSRLWKATMRQVFLLSSASSRVEK